MSNLSNSVVLNKEELLILDSFNHKKWNTNFNKSANEKDSLEIRFYKEICNQEAQIFSESMQEVNKSLESIISYIKYNNELSSLFWQTKGHSNLLFLILHSYEYINESLSSETYNKNYSLGVISNVVILIQLLLQNTEIGIQVVNCK